MVEKAALLHSEFFMNTDKTAYKVKKFDLEERNVLRPNVDISCIKLEQLRRPYP